MTASPRPVPRTIVGVEREGPAVVVLGLDCGHRRHVRHRPPLDEHPWVRDDQAVAARVGQSIECLGCAQRRIPPGSEVYRRTADFDEATVPAGLRGEHRTRAGVWGRVVVTRGRLWLEFSAPLHDRVEVEPQQPAAIPPGLVHRVRLAGPVCFHVEFLRLPSQSG